MREMGAKNGQGAGLVDAEAAPRRGPGNRADMSSPTYRIERDRGIKEYRQQLAGLRKKWPLAFPVNDQDVRPLAADATDGIAAVKGWSLPYTLGVLSRWKMAPAYCQAILRYNQRIALEPPRAGKNGAKVSSGARRNAAAAGPPAFQSVLRERIDPDRWP